MGNIRRCDAVLNASQTQYPGAPHLEGFVSKANICTQNQNKSLSLSPLKSTLHRLATYLRNSFIGFIVWLNVCDTMCVCGSTLAQWFCNVCTAWYATWTHGGLFTTSYCTVYFITAYNELVKCFLDRLVFSAVLLRPLHWNSSCPRVQFVCVAARVCTLVYGCFRVVAQKEHQYS